MNIIKIKNNLVNLNEINTMQFDKKESTIDIYFKNGLLVTIDDVDEYYFKELFNRINNML